MRIITARCHCQCHDRIAHGEQDSIAQHPTTAAHVRRSKPPVRLFLASTLRKPPRKEERRPADPGTSPPTTTPSTPSPATRRPEPHSRRGHRTSTRLQRSIAASRIHHDSSSCANSPLPTAAQCGCLSRPRPNGKRPPQGMRAWELADIPLRLTADHHVMSPTPTPASAAPKSTFAMLLDPQVANLPATRAVKHRRTLAHPPPALPSKGYALSYAALAPLQRNRLCQSGKCRVTLSCD